MIAIRARNACRTAHARGRRDLAARATAALVARDYRKALALAGAAVRWAHKVARFLQETRRNVGRLLLRRLTRVSERPPVVCHIAQRGKIGRVVETLRRPMARFLQAIRSALPLRAWGE